MTCSPIGVSGRCFQHPEADTYMCQVCGSIECGTVHAQRDGVNVCHNCRGGDPNTLRCDGKPDIERRMTDKEVQAALPALENGFANSLYEAKQKYGWSKKQQYWAHKLVYDAHKPEREPDTIVLAVQALFDYVRDNGMKRPLIAYKDLVLDVYGPRSKRAGQIRVHLMRDGEKVWCGSIDNAKVFVREQEAVTLLKELNEDPINKTKAQGQLTGHCCFCRKELRTKESVGAGYGPICADKWGLPWGEETAAHYDVMKARVE